MNQRANLLFGLLACLLWISVLSSSYFSGSISSNDLTCAYLSDSVYSDLNITPTTLVNTPQWIRIKTVTVETSAVNIYINTNLKQLVVSFRGSMTSATTATVSDWISNFNIFSTDIVMNGRVYGQGHRGFWYEYLMVRSAVINTLLLPQYSDYKLLVTGHSQGVCYISLIFLFAMISIYKFIGGLLFL